MPGGKGEGGKGGGGEGGGKRKVKKFVTELVEGVGSYEISFPCLVTGVYKVQV